MKKIILVLVIIAILALSSIGASLMADPGGGVTPNSIEHMADPGGGVTPCNRC